MLCSTSHSEVGCRSYVVFDLSAFELQSGKNIDTSMSVIC